MRSGPWISHRRNYCFSYRSITCSKTTAATTTVPAAEAAALSSCGGGCCDNQQEACLQPPQPPHQLPPVRRIPGDCGGFASVRRSPWSVLLASTRSSTGASSSSVMHGPCLRRTTSSSANKRRPGILRRPRTRSGFPTDLDGRPSGFSHSTQRIGMMRCFNSSIIRQALY